MDAQLELKKRARRRLVGAFALALTAAVVLPMVMDEEPKPLGQDIQIRIPSQGPAEPPALRPPKAGARPDAAPARREPGDAAPGEKPAVAAPAEKPADSVPSVAEPATPAEKPDKPADKPPSTEGKAVRPDSRADEARAQAILSGQSERFVVQLGVFADPQNAKRVQARVKAEGYNSFTEVLKTGEGAKTRVRAGPFDSREAAEKARDKLKRAGLNGIVAPRS